MKDYNLYKISCSTNKNPFLIQNKKKIRFVYLIYLSLSDIDFERASTERFSILCNLDLVSSFGLGCERCNTCE